MHSIQNLTGDVRLNQPAHKAVNEIHLGAHTPSQAVNQETYVKG